MISLLSSLNSGVLGVSANKAGTGCVHTAPGHGSDDFHIGKKYGLEIYNPVDAAGKFIPEVEHFGGMNIFDANPKIVTVPERRELSHVEGQFATPPTTAHHVCFRF